MKVKIILVGLCLVLIGTLLLWPEEPEIIVEEPKDDTGLGREQTEDLMRTIGYVQ